MTDRIITAFDSIHAEEALKEKTLDFLRREIYKKQKPKLRAPVISFASGFALIFCVALIYSISMKAYFTETAYIDFDVNPAVEFAVNRFDRVIGVYAYNAEADRALEGLRLEHKTYKDAVSSMLGAFAEEGYLRDDSLVSVTLQTNDSGRQSDMLSGLTEYVETGVSGHHGSVEVDVFLVSGSVRNDAHALELTPAKYLAILELQEVDPTVTVEGCRGHTIGELKSLTQSHGAGHHAESGTDSDDGQTYRHNAQAHHGSRSRHG